MNDELYAELHQAKAEWFEEKKRAREAEDELVRLHEETAERIEQYHDWLNEKAAELTAMREEIEQWRKEAQYKEDERVKLREALEYIATIAGLGVDQVDVRVAASAVEVEGAAVVLEVILLKARNALEEA